jgi:glycosyltransferase involved in cell wall biosynthesis
MLDIREWLLKRKVARMRRRREARGYAYTDRPRVSFVIQFFNKRHNVRPIVERLRLAEPEEIIVNDDGSIDGTHEEWMRLLDRPNEFLIRYNNLHEIRGYDRAVRFAKGEFVCFMQDDDLPPPDRSWVDHALGLFGALPQLAILGGRDGLNIRPSRVPRERYEVFAAMGAPKFGKGALYKEPATGIPFMFCTIANRAPWFVRRDEFLRIGGIGTRFAPFLCDDDDACLRAWLAGAQVGMYNSGFDRHIDGTAKRGSVLFQSDLVKRQEEANFAKIDASYGPQIADGCFRALVDKANSQLTPVA